jgi:hypothetical protein
LRYLNIQVLNRLKAQGYSEHVAQVCTAWQAVRRCSHFTAAVAAFGVFQPYSALYYSQRACLEVHQSKKEVSYDSAVNWIRRHDIFKIDKWVLAGRKLAAASHACSTN